MKKTLIFDDCRDCPYVGSFTHMGMIYRVCFNLFIVGKPAECPSSGIPDWCQLLSVEDVMSARCGNCKYYGHYEGCEDEPVCLNGKSKYSAMPVDDCDDACEEWELWRREDD